MITSGGRRCGSERNVWVRPRVCTEAAEARVAVGLAEPPQAASPAAAAVVVAATRNVLRVIGSAQPFSTESECAVIEVSEAPWDTEGTASPR